MLLLQYISFISFSPILKVNLYVFYVPLRVRQLDSNGGFVFEYILDADVKEEKKNSRSCMQIQSVSFLILFKKKVKSGNVWVLTIG